MLKVEGRGSAIMSLSLFLVFILACNVIVEAATYTVGDAAGWKFNVNNWPAGKKFAAGDTLVFKYNKQMHNVVEVSKEDQIACNVPTNAKVLNSGNDQIKLNKGDNFFICGIPGHCQGGMSIAINAV